MQTQERSDKCAALSDAAALAALRKPGVSIMRWSAMVRCIRPRRGILAAIAGLACSLDLPGVVSTAHAQLSPLYTDDSVTAGEALAKVQDLAASGNVGEAARVTQSLLTNEGERVIEAAAASDVFISVRQRVHDVLRATPALLRRYRDDEEPEAARAFKAGEDQQAERLRGMTRSGLAAALRLARRHIDAARFDAAWLTIQPLDQHPDLVGVKSDEVTIAPDEVAVKEAARVAMRLSIYLPRPDVRARAAAWAGRAGLNDELAKIKPIDAPTRATLRATTPMDAQPPVDVRQVPDSPLAWVTMSPAVQDDGEDEDGRVSGEGRDRALLDAWVMPAIAGDTLYVNDGVQIGAWDRYTLMPLWTLRPPPLLERGNDSRDDPLIQTRLLEDVTTVQIEGGVGVGVTGFAVTSRRNGDGRVHAFDAATGRLLWSQSVAWLDRQLADGGSVRGPALISGDTVVVAIRKVATARRVTSLYMAGLDLYTGELRWLRLVGSVGMLAFQQIARATDAAVVDQGVVYRTDALGLMCAIESTSGRVRWVKRLSAPPDTMLGRVTNPVSQPWSCATPVLDGETLIVVDPSTRDVLRVEKTTGATISRLAASESISPRYLVRTAKWLACVGETKVAFVPIASLDPAASVRLEIETVGRVTPSGERFALPIQKGIQFVDPDNINAVETMPLQTSGNALLADGHAVVADSTRVQSFLTWERARTLLEKQASARPSDAKPVLTLAELAYRAGRIDQVAIAADRALDIADVSTDVNASATSRSQLFSLLWKIVEAGRARFDVDSAKKTARVGGAVAPGAGTTAPDTTGTEPDAPRAQPNAIAGGVDPASTLTLPLLDDLAARLGRAAESPSHRAWHALSVGWIAAARATRAEDASRAIEAYQSVLGDAALSASPSGDGPLAGRAGDIALDRLVAVIGRWGVGTYASYAAQAQRELTDLGPAPAPRDLESLARRYPCAVVVPSVWSMAAQSRQAAGEHVAAAANLASGLAAARRLASWGVVEATSTSQEIARRLFTSLVSHGREGHALRLAREMPAAASAADTATLQRTLATLNRRPRLGKIRASDHGGSRVLNGWVIEEPIIADGPGHATDQASLVNATNQMVGVFAPRVEDGRIAPLWTRSHDRGRAPRFVRVDWDAAYLFWPAARGGTVERINTDGVSAWRTPEMRQLFGGDAPDADTVERFDTLSGRVKVTDLLIAMDATSLCVIERSGRGARFDLATGAIKWSGRLPMNRVYDAVLVDGVLVAAGTGDETPRGRAAEAPILAALGPDVAPDAGPDAVRVIGSADTLGRGPGVRWLRAAPASGTLPAGVIVGLEEGLAIIDLPDGKTRWSVIAPPMQRLADCRVLADRLFVVDQNHTLRLLDAATGQVAEDPLDDRGRLREDVSSVRLVTGKDHILLVGDRGVVALNRDGSVLGEDAIDERVTLGLPVIGENAVAFIGGDAPVGHGDLGKEGLGLRVIATPGGKMIQSTAIVMPRLPAGVLAIDDKVLVTAGQLTVVLEAGE